MRSVDVRGGSHPADGGTVLVTFVRRAAQMPAVRTVTASQSKPRLERRVRPNHGLPGRSHALTIVGVHRVEQAGSQTLRKRDACVLQPGSVAVIDAARCIG